MRNVYHHLSRVALPAFLCAATGAFAQLPVPVVEISFSETNGVVATNSGSLGGAGVFVQQNSLPAYASLVPNGPFAPPNNISAVDFGTIAAGQGGRAIDFPTPGTFNAFTVAGWLNCRDLNEGGGGNRITFALSAQNGPGFDLVQLASGALRIGINQWPDGANGGGPSSSAGKITADPQAGPNNWVFFALTFDKAVASGNFKYYFGKPNVQAALDSQHTYQVGASVACGALTLGNFSTVDTGARNATGPNGGSRNFRGLMDEIRIFNRALTLTEIQQVQQSSPFAPVDQPPVITQIYPTPGGTLRQLSQVEVLFNEPVQGVNVSDLLLNGQPATNLITVAPDQYVFHFPSPATGTVAVTWAQNHGITDFGDPPNSFASNSWSYTYDPSAAFARPMISEFMADNNNTLNDEDGQSSDWIEIYNPDLEPIDLEGYFLTDNANLLTQWRFPRVTLPANSYLVVFASEKNRTNPAAVLHTNFKLERSGEFLALVDPATNIISSFSPFYPRQREDASYGRDRLSPELTGYYDRPTPGAPNATSGVGFAPEVQFSHVSGPFTGPFELTLSTANTNAVIRYLLVNNATSAADTNGPTASSPAYTGPLTISASVQVRARAFLANNLPSPLRSETFIAIQTNLLPANSDLPIVVVHTLGNGDFNSSVYKGAHLSIYEPVLGRASLTNAPAVTTRAALKVRGNTSANAAKKSWSMELWDEFNDDKNVSLLDMPAESDWVLYGPGSMEPVLIHNPFAYELARRLGNWAPRFRFVELYLNTSGGTLTTNNYHGVYVLMEKIKIAPGRVDIDRLEPEDTNSVSVTGGYLLQMDRLESGESGVQVPAVLPNTLLHGGNALTYTVPKESEIRLPQRAAQRHYIRDYLTNFVNTLNSPAFADPVSGYEKYVNIPPSLDNHIIKTMTFTVDAFNFSTFLYKPRNGKLVFGPIWDFDRALESKDDPRDDDPRRWRYSGSWEAFDFWNYSWWGRMFQDTNFFQRWVDRYQELRQSELSLTNLGALIDNLTGQIRESQVRDLARWPGNAPRTSFQWEIDHMKEWLTNRLHFMDTNFVPMPALLLPAGRTYHGAQVQITVPATPANTEVYYTLDGSDPRLPNGTISPSATRYTGPITISDNVHIVARSYNPAYRNLVGGPSNGNPPVTASWSGPAKGVYWIREIPLVISELMYHPAAPSATDTNDADNFEFIELKNVGTNDLSLLGIRFIEGIAYTFTPGSVVTSLPPGGTVVLVKNLAAFRSRYPAAANVAGEYSGNLDNAGERLLLVGPRNEPILDFTYNDSWAQITDGFGFSLVAIDPYAARNAYLDPMNWRRSANYGGAPGAPDLAPANLPPVVINEALTHTDLPLVDAIELFNPGSTEADIGGWWITDDFRSPAKFQLPAGTRVPANGYLVLYETNSFGPRFQLSSTGDELYLFSANGTNFTGYVHGFDFGAQFNSVTFGRHVISTGNDHFVAQSAPTLGAPNAGPKVGPVIISEIMYRPLDIEANGVFYDNELEEFIELHNLSAQPVPLFDPAYPTNTWRIQDAVEFAFPPNTTIPAGGYLLVVNFHPTNTIAAEAFRARHNLSAAIPLFGPYGGKLDNSSGRIELVQPDTPNLQPGVDFGAVPYVLVERVSYKDSAPWTIAADGIGLSLQRLVLAAYANDPANWVATTPTPVSSRPGGELPAITLQPVSQSVIGNTAVSLAVSATSPTPLGYQWLFNGSIIPGATNASLQIPKIKVTHAGGYQVVVFNSAGAVASQEATVAVTAPVTITQQPQKRSVRPTNTVTFSVAAVSTYPITYQWAFNGENIPGATNTTLTITNVQPEDDGFYTVTVTDQIGSDVSEPARLAVLVDPIIVLQPQHQIVRVGDPLTVPIGVTNTATLPMTYRWRRTSVYWFTNTTWSRQDALVLTNVQLTDANIYSVVVNNEARSAGNLSLNALVAVVDPPANQVATPGAEAIFTVGIGNPGPTNRPAYITLQWLFNGTEIPGATTNSLVIPNVQAAQLGTYGVRVTLITNVPVAPVTFSATLAFPMQDGDGDGMPDDWENAHPCLSATSADATADADGDAMANRDEYLAGTDPCNPQSYLRIQLVNVAAAGTTNALLRFGAVSNKTYTILFKNILDGTTNWHKLCDIESSPVDRTIEAIDSGAAAPMRYYRLVTPRVD